MDKYRMVTLFQARLLNPVVRGVLDRGWRIPGYALLETLAQAGFAVDGNTLYPLLRRLEKQGLLTSEWNTEEPRPRKFYSVTPHGAQVLDQLRTEWGSLDRAISALDGGQE